MNTEVILAKTNRAIKSKRAEAASGSSIAGELNLFLKTVAGPARRNMSVPEAFEQIAGSTLARNCRVESLKAGVLKVKVKAGPYMFELCTRAGEIVEQIKQRCPSSNIREIRPACME